MAMSIGWRWTIWLEAVLVSRHIFMLTVVKCTMLIHPRAPS